MMTITEFLSEVYGADASGHLVLWTRQDKRARWLPAGNLEAAGRLATQLATTCDIYFGAALQNKDEAFAKWRRENPHVQGEPTTRGYSETTSALPGLWADIDVRGPAHKAVNLPPTKAAARALLTEFPLPPTLVIDSGYGLQAWWLFKELWVFEDQLERGAAQALARRFLATLQSIARAHRWQIDPTSDLARVLRVPGTFNRKLQPVPVRVIEVNKTRYNPSDFEPYLIEVEPEASPCPPWHGPSGALAPVLQHCRFLQHCRDDAATLPEPEWWATVSNLARLKGGREAIHALSAPYPRYSPVETEQKIEHALASSGPHTCAYIQHHIGFTGCPSAGCGVKAPAALGVSRHGVVVAAARRRLVDITDQARQALARLWHGEER